MTKDEALRLALEALYGFIPYLPLEHDKPQCDRYDQAITAIKATLEAKDGPVAKFHVEHRTNACSEVCDEKGKVYATCDWTTEASKRAQLICDLLNTTPPQRTWVGLTDEEVKKIVGLDRYTDLLKEVVQYVEAKLRSKNESKN
jgi:hypothetical protein